MTLLVWLVFGGLVLFTFIWFALVRRDAKSYVESQVKALGEENRHYVDTHKLSFFLFSYAFMLTVVLVFFVVYFLAL